MENDKKGNFITPITTPGESTPYDVNFIPEEIVSINDNEISDILILIDKNIEEIRCLKSSSNVEVLDKYNEVEESIETHIKSKNFKKTAFKFFLRYSRNILKETFQNYDYSEEVNSIIEKNFKSFISLEIDKPNEHIMNAFKKAEQEPNKHIKEMTQLYFSMFKNSFSDTSKLPYFLLKPYKIQLSIIFSKIGKKYFDHRTFFDNLNHKYKKEIEQLTEQYRQVIDNKKNLFDERIFDFETRKLLFKLFVLSNIDTIKRNDYSLAIFMNNIKKYLILMNILQIEDNSTISLYVELVNKSIQLSTKEISKEINSIMYLINNVFDNYKENKYSNYVFLVLSFSLMMNNFFFALNKGFEKEDKTNDFTLLNSSVYKVEFVPDFKYFCSAREKQFLFNINNCISRDLEILNSSTKINASELNLYIEAIVFFDTFQYYSKNLFDKESKIKINMDSKKILSAVSESINDNLELLQIWKELYAFITKPRKSVFKEIVTSVSGLISIFRRKSNVNEEENETEIDIDIENVKLGYYNPKLITPNIFIFITGFTSKEPERFWEKIIYRYSNVLDMYFYEWESLSNKSSDIYKYFAKFVVKYISTSSNSLTIFNEYDKFKRENQNIFKSAKFKTKIYGQLLAFILISRSLFKFQSVNLVAFSMGANIVKHCLKTLNLFFRSVPEAFDLIQNVVFIGGISDFKNNSKWNDIFKIVGGRIINVYSDRDTFLKSFFAKSNPQPIGISPIINNNKQIENYDVTDEKLEHYLYQDKLDSIFDKIKIL